MAREWCWSFDPAQMRPAQRYGSVRLTTGMRAIARKRRNAKKNPDQQLTCESR
jgi:hypothetical protein